MWTITTQDGDVLATFRTEEQAWATFFNDTALFLLIERHEEETQDGWYAECHICCDGVEVMFH